MYLISNQTLRPFWNWWTGFYKLLESGVPVKGLPQLVRPRLGRLSWGEKDLQSIVFFNIFSGLNKRELQARPLVVELKYMLIGCAHTELHFP